MSSNLGFSKYIATKHEDLEDRSVYYWYDQRIFSDLDAAIFEPGGHAGVSGLQAAGKGRGSAYAFRHGEWELILRHYWRGGQIKKILRDRFVFRSLASSRPVREFLLLEHMRALGLPVPRPAAARLVRFRHFYQADFIMEKIADAQVLLEVIADRVLPADIWHRIGSCIRRLHDAGVQHVDLNSRNIMLDSMMSPWIIDFDNCRLRGAGPWRQQDLARLKRSMDKHANRQPLAFTPEDWAELLAGYEKGVCCAPT